MSEISLKDYGDRDRWLASRTTAIGASEVAGLFLGPNGQSLSPYTTPFVLWLEKTGQQEPFDTGAEHLEIGTFLEPAIAALYSHRTGRTLWKPPSPFAVAEHPTLPFLRSTPDGWVLEAPDRDGRGLAQFKNVNLFKGHDWDEGIPFHIQVQVQAELAVTGRDWNSVGVLIGGGSAFRAIDVERNEDFIVEMVEVVKDFWAKVEARIPPPLDASPRTLAAIKRLHPHDDGSTVKLPEEAVMWLDKWAEADDTAKAAKEVDTLAESKLREMLGAATFGELPDGRTISLKTTERAGYTPKPVAPCTYRTLRLVKKPTKGPRK